MPQEVGKIAHIESAPTLKINNCISYSKDKVTMGKGNVAHFVSSDGLAESEINKDLIKNQLFDVEGLQSEQPKPGDTVVYSKKNRYIFSMVVKHKKNDKVFLNFISSAILALRNAMETLGVKNVKISSKGNNLDFISWVSVEQILQQHFKDSGLHIAICLGEVISPPFHKRDEIIKEFHESVVGGHKGISKTYRRVRSSYYWDNMKSDVRRVLGGCKTCMRNKLTRKGTRMPMIISDTPKEPFEKIQIDLVGPLPVTPRGNQYILTIQCIFTIFTEMRLHELKMLIRQESSHVIRLVHGLKYFFLFVKN